MSEGGLLLTESADTAKLSPDGSTADGHFEGTSFGDHWPSKTEISTVVHMAANAIEIEVTARNVGDQPEPMGIGWHPRFALPGGTREGVRLKLPEAQTLVMNDRVRGEPSGRIQTAGASVDKYQAHAVQLGSETLDAALVNLKPSGPGKGGTDHGASGDGASAEILDTTRGMGLRLTALSSDIRELHVLSPGGAPYLGVAMQTNYDDPFGHQWAGGDGIATLAPGASMTWKIRLEIFALTDHAAAR